MEDAAANREKSRTGTVVAGRYRVERLVARGGMATVYLARQIGLERLVALKLLSPPPDGDEGASFDERFRLEASTLASLDHPNVVVVHDFGTTDDGVPFLAMEFVDGPRLTDLLKPGPLPVDRTLDLVQQICRGLRYAHRKGIVHRDLKPSNLLVKNEDGQDHVKIVDFGLVKLSETDQSITRTGLVLGSPHCMSPEQVMGLDVDARTDLYAVGVLLFRCITGQYPFHGGHGTATMMAHVSEPIPSLSAHAGGVVLPDGLEAVVTRCLQKKPDDRYSDLSELLSALARVTGAPTESTTTTSTVAPPYRRANPPSRAAPVLVAALLLVALVAVGGLAIATWVATRPAPEVAAPAVAPPPPPVPEPTPPQPEVVQVAPEPVPEPEPPEVAPAPARPRPKAKVKVAPEPDPKAPEGYMGMPEELE